MLQEFGWFDVPFNKSMALMLFFLGKLERSMAKMTFVGKQIGGT